MQQIVKKFFNKLIDADSAEHLVPADRFISGQNFRIGTTDYGGQGYIENILKNAERSHTLPSGGVNTRIGFAADEENGHIIKFNQNSNGDDGIYLYDIVAQEWYTVLMSDDVTGGLNFNKYYLINGAFVINNLLYFNDNYNEPRRINLGACMGMYHSSYPVSSIYTLTSPVDESEITLIRKPCAYPVSVSKFGDSGFANNFIENESYKFAVQWVHYDGEEAVLSEWSEATLFNYSGQSFNAVSIILDRTEEVPQSVRLVRLVVLIESTNKAFVIKEWDRLISGENTDIETQNLSFNFYGNITGEALDSATVSRPFYNVPLLSGSIEIGKNRIVAVNNLEGYETPTTTSLALSLPTPISLGFTTLNKTLISFFTRNGRSQPETFAFSCWLVYLTEVLPVGYYMINGTDTLREDTSFIGGAAYGNGGDVPLANPAGFTSVAFSGLTYKGATLTAVAENTKPSDTWRWDGPYTVSTPYPSTITGISSVTYGVLLPQALFKGAIVFYDRYLRKCSVVFTDDVIEIPARNYAFSVGYSSILWSLSYANALAEIPDWAYYAIPVLTRDQRHLFFVESFDNAVKYATKNTTTGLLEFTNTTFSTGTVAVAINANALLQANLGWVYADGDSCILIDNANNRYEIPVIGQEGDYVLLKATDVGDTSAKTWVYRLYVPYKASTQEPFYERGQMIQILNPGTISRTYGTLSGTFRSDTVALTRNYNATTYFAAAMNPNDAYFDKWYTDAGRGNLITKLGQVRYYTGLRFSNVYLQGTQTNGLSSFEALNREILSEDMGTLQKAILTSRVQKEGSVMLVLGENETASVYLGETEYIDANANPYLVKSERFIGQINILKGGYGTSNHESVVQWDGQVGFYSKLSGRFIMYSNNGLFPISDYGMKRVANLFSKDYASLTVEEIEALGSRPFVFGGIDPYHDEFMWSIPATRSTPPKGYLQDYVSPDLPVIYPYDIYDGEAKVLVFKKEMDGWGAPHSYQTEGFINIRNLLFSAKNGELFEHNYNDGTENSYSKFYEEDAPPAIGFILNEEPNIVKEFLTLSIEGNALPDFAHFRTERPNVQSSDSQSQSEFTTREGVFYLDLKRDRLSPNTTGSFDVKLYKGDKMRGQWLKVYCKFETNSLIQIRFFNVGYTKSLGGTT